MAELEAVAGILDLTVEHGVGFTFTATWKVDGVPVPLTDYTAKLHVRESSEDTGTPLLELTEAAGLVLGGAAGTIIVTIDKTQNVFENRSLVWDIVLEDVAGVPIKLLGGSFNSIMGVTK